MKQVAQRVKDLPNVVGFDSFNEPSTGYIGVKDLTRHINILRTDDAPTPFESMLLGAGLPRKIDVYADEPDRPAQTRPAADQSAGRERVARRS